MGARFFNGELGMMYVLSDDAAEAGVGVEVIEAAGPPKRDELVPGAGASGVDGWGCAIARGGVD
jgi:hypothetical protein